MDVEVQVHGVLLFVKCLCCSGCDSPVSPFIAKLQMDVLEINYTLIVLSTVHVFSSLKIHEHAALWAYSLTLKSLNTFINVLIYHSMSSAPSVLTCWIYLV